VLDSLGVPTEVRLQQGQVLEEIFGEIRRGDYDLVVTGASLSHGSLHTYILGDVTREIVNRSECAVLVARAAGKSPTITASLRRLLTRLAHGDPADKDTQTKRFRGRVRSRSAEEAWQHTNPAR